MGHSWLVERLSSFNKPFDLALLRDRRPFWFSQIKINVTKPRVVGEIVWFLFVQWILAFITLTGYREHDQDGGSMAKVYCVHHPKWLISFVQGIEPTTFWVCHTIRFLILYSNYSSLSTGRQFQFQFQFHAHFTPLRVLKNS